MTRDLDRLANRQFDVLVIGAGIYGATIAWDAAQRGLSVAIIDRGDFGAGTSFNSLKTVHGGLRSLQRAAFAEMREFIRERRTLCRIAPHLVHPLPFIVPTYRHPMRNRPLMRAVMAVNDLVARDRNDLPDPSKHLPPSGVVSREECLRLNPAIDPAGVTGGAIWHDCQMYNADRVTLSFLISACAAGAVAVNDVEALGVAMDGQRIVGVRAHDRLGHQPLDIRARQIVNAAGPWAWTVLHRLGVRAARPAPGFSKAMNLVTRSVTTTHGVGGLVDGRFLFIAPWRDCSIIGTSHDEHHGEADALTITRRDVEAFLREIQHAFPRANLTTTDVRLVHRGLLPAAAGAGGHGRLLKNSLILDHRSDGVEGLMTVLGVRYTTARATARRVVDRAFRTLGRPMVPCRTETTPLVGGEISSFADFEREAASAPAPGFSTDDRRRLVRCYGTAYPAILRLAMVDPGLAAPLSASCPVTRAEILHAARHEMAVHLSDAVIRRTDAGSAGHPGPDALRSAAEVMAAELRWDASRTQAEIDAADRFYDVPGTGGAEAPPLQRTSTAAP